MEKTQDSPSHLYRVMRNMSSGLPTRSDTNRAIQSQITAPGLYFGVRGRIVICSIYVAKIKPLIS